MLYHALFVPEGAAPFPRSILEEPHICKYYEGWGRPGDQALIAEVDGLKVGAVWVRKFRASDPGYGFVSEEIPELNISLIPGMEGHGLGTKLMLSMIDLLKSTNESGVSLSVDKSNMAIRLYTRLGFQIVKEHGNPTLLLKF